MQRPAHSQLMSKAESNQFYKAKNMVKINDYAGATIILASLMRFDTAKLLMARIYSLTDKPVEATDLLTAIDVNALDSKNKSTYYYRVIDYYLLLRNIPTSSLPTIDECFVALRQLTHNDNETEQLWIKYLYAKKQYHETLKAIDAYLGTSARLKHHNIHNFKLRCLLALGDLTTAQQEAATIKNLFPENTRRVSMKKLLAQVDTVEFGKDIDLDAIANNPLELLETAINLTRTNTKKAEQAFKILVKNFPLHWRGRLRYGIFLSAQSEDYHQAIKQLNTVVNFDRSLAKNLHPCNDMIATAYISLSIAHKALRNFRQADEMLELSKKFATNDEAKAKILSTEAKNVIFSRTVTNYSLAHQLDHTRLDRHLPNEESGNVTVVKANPPKVEANPPNTQNSENAFIFNEEDFPALNIYKKPEVVIQPIKELPDEQPRAKPAMILEQRLAPLPAPPHKRKPMVPPKRNAPTAKAKTEKAPVVIASPQRKRSLYTNTCLLFTAAAVVGFGLLTQYTSRNSFR